MNAAEITDKLGLHSLRQRAWVCPKPLHPLNLAQYTNERAVHPIHLRYFR
jgi:hypothetical protein